MYLNGWEAENIGIANGKGGYSAQSSDETIVTATVIDNRLWLSSHGKKGKVTVTVTDKDGNYVTLPVTVSYGVLTFMCVDQPEFQVSRPSEDMLSLDSESELQEKVNVAMAPYSFINKGDICILRPDDVYHLSEEGTGGKFIYKTEDEQILVEGTYQIEWASLGGKQKKAFVFTYIDKNNVEQQHTFFNQLLPITQPRQTNWKSLYPPNIQLFYPPAKLLPDRVGFIGWKTEKGFCFYIYR